MKKYYKVLVACLAISLLLLASYKLKRRIDAPPIFVSKQDSAFNLNQDFLKIFNLGLSRMISSSLWVQTLLESDLEHYKNHDLNSWMYLRFKNMAELDPLFYQAYRYGGQYLSIVKDDVYGAKKIYELGLNIYHNDFWLNFHAGFNYFFELDDYASAADCYGRILNQPLASKVMQLPSMWARLTASTGDLTSAYNFLHSAYEQSPPKSFLRQKYFDSLYAIKAQTDLECLNAGKGSCNLYDLKDKLYVRDAKTNAYVAQSEWRPFRVNKKGAK